MSASRRTRAASIAAGRPLLSGDLATVMWLTGLATDIEYGPSPFTVSPLVLLDPDGSVLKITSEDETGGWAATVRAAARIPSSRRCAVSSSVGPARCASRRCP